MLSRLVRSFWLSASLVLISVLLFVLISDYIQFSGMFSETFNSKQTLFVAAKDMFAFVLVGTAAIFALSYFSDYRAAALRKRQDVVVNNHYHNQNLN
jgi:hypothetical protein